MLTMQYSYALAPNYDMGRIHRRVAERGRLFDGYPGLVQKAFLIAKRGKEGASGNFYAPFYVWKSAAAMLDFLASDKFAAVTGAFGWPAVRSWQGITFGQVTSIQDGSIVPRAASRELITVPAHTDLAALRTAEAEKHQAILATLGVYSNAVGLDAATWQLVRFTLWSELPAARPAGDLFEVLHLSTALGVSAS